MSEQFFYAEFKLLQKRGVVTVSVGKAQEVILEVPRKLKEDWKRENPERELTFASSEATNRAATSDIKKALAMIDLFATTLGAH